MRERKAPAIVNPESTFERETRQILERLGDLPILRGRLLERVNLDTTPVRVAHGLGRPYRGYLVVHASAAATVHVDAASDTAVDRFASLVASAPVTVSLWVF